MQESTLGFWSTAWKSGGPRLRSRAVSSTTYTGSPLASLLYRLSGKVDRRLKGLLNQQKEVPTGPCFISQAFCLTLQLVHCLWNWRPLQWSTLGQEIKQTPWKMTLTSSAGFSPSEGKALSEYATIQISKKGVPTSILAFTLFAPCLVFCLTLQLAQRLGHGRPPQWSTPGQEIKQTPCKIYQSSGASFYHSGYKGQGNPPSGCATSQGCAELGCAGIGCAKLGVHRSLYNFCSERSKEFVSRFTLQVATDNNKSNKLKMCNRRHLPADSERTLQNACYLKPV